jgi:hypothetical protein
MPLTTCKDSRDATEWLGTERRFASCPSTQGSLARFIVRVATADHAVAVLRLLQSHPRHEFWNDDAPSDESVLQGVVGHRQVTDSYRKDGSCHINPETGVESRGAPETVFAREQPRLEIEDCS